MKNLRYHLPATILAWLDIDYINLRHPGWLKGNNFISWFKQKILIPLGLKIFNLFSLIRKIFIFLFSFIRKIFAKIYKSIIRPFFISSYLSRLKQKDDQSSTKNPNKDDSVLSWLTSRNNLYLVVIIISIFVATGNIQARGKGQSDPASRTILFQMLGNESEEVVQETSLLVGGQLNFNTPSQESVATSLRTDRLVMTDEKTINTSEESEDSVEQIEVLMPNQEVGALVQPNISATSPAPRTEITDYFVEEGDVLGTIAEKFGVSISTILWENNLTTRSVIKPGQKLTILPTTGLTHKVSSGDTISAIAKKYRADSSNIINYNDLADATDIQVSQTLIIPGGKKPAPIYVAPTPRYASSSNTSNSQQVSYSNTPSDQELYNQRIYSRPSSTYGSHRFPWGQCTWYVAQRRYVPWSGHAKQWIANARAYGYSIGNSPKVGAIIVTRESWYGHVGYVESVGSGTVTFAESNYKGLGVITRRTLNVNDRRILGYIY